VDSTDIWVFGEIGDPGSTWVQKETIIQAGTYIISIETDFAGYAWVDELEIQTNFSPFPTISSTLSSPTNESPIPITIIFSKDVTGFGQNDVVVSNGSTDNFSGSGSNYTVDVTPASDGLVTVDIPEDISQDEDGNGNLAATFSIIYDSSHPSVVISSEESSPTHDSTFVVEILFSEPVLDFVQGDLEIENGTISTFSGSDSLYGIGVTPSTDGIVTISLDENMAYDPAGNGNLASNTLEIYYDNLPPIVDITDIGEAGTLDTLTIEWQSTDVSNIEKHTIFVTNNGQNYSLLDSTAGDVFTYDWVVPNIISDQNRIVVESIDEWGLVSDDTTNIFVIIDNDPPEIEVLSPSEGFSVPENVLVTVSWNNTDNIAIFNHLFEYAANGVNYDTLLYTSNLTDSNSVEFSFTGVTSTGLIRVTVSDPAGNTATDVSAQFSVTDNTPPTVNLTFPAAESVVSIGDSLSITWNDSDNVGVETISLYYNTSGDWATITENTADVNEYDWIIPNEPTNNLQIRIVVQDAVGFADTSEVSGDMISISG
jgi:hypothetical protein